MNQLFNTKPEIVAWLDEWQVKNYHLVADPTYGFVVNVDGCVDLSSKDITCFRVKFKSVASYFDASRNRLTTLLGFPDKICGNVDVSYNKLQDIGHTPQKIFGNFQCSHNQLTILAGGPQIVKGHFFCNDNALTSLAHCPESVGGGFNCASNSIKSLEFIPKHIGAGNDFVCYNNPELGDTQNIKSFAYIEKLHQVYAKAKQEKQDLSKAIVIPQNHFNSIKNYKI